MSPIPCAHCGTNFMRRDLDPEAAKICNNCSIREQTRISNQGKKDMSKVQLLIEVDRPTQIEIEEICLNEGVSLSEYVLNLHLKSKSATDPEARAFFDKRDEEIKEPEKQLQKKSKGIKK
jgi:hypothetical protein